MLLTIINIRAALFTSLLLKHYYYFHSVISFQTFFLLISLDTYNVHHKRAHCCRLFVVLYAAEFFFFWIIYDFFIAHTRIHCRRKKIYEIIVLNTKKKREREIDLKCKMIAFLHTNERFNNCKRYRCRDCTYKVKWWFIVLIANSFFVDCWTVNR